MDRLSSYSQRRLLGPGSQKGLCLKLKPIWLALLSSYFVLFYLYSTTNFFIPLLRSTPSDLFLESPPSDEILPNHSPTTVRSIQNLPTNASQSLKSVASQEAVGAALKSQRPSSIGTERDESEKKKDVYHERDIFMEEYKEMKRRLKVYVYPHGKDDPFANVLLPADEEPGGNYASESYFKKALMKSQFLTDDPTNADLFFMPFSIASLRHDRRVGVGGIQGFVRDYIREITHKYPYWNRSGGADHFYVACHSVGRSAMEKAPQVKFNAIQVVCSSSYFLTGYVAHKDACLPQIWPRQGNPPNLASSDRKKLAFFAGGMNSRERKQLVKTWGNDSEIFAHAGRLRTPYADELLGSKFCLHAKGYEVNTARIGDSLYYGCVPVVVADYYDLPFADVLNWNSFSVVVNAIDIPLLKKVLKGISPEEYQKLHSNVLKVRKHFKWHSSPVDFDAFYMVMYELWLRRSSIKFPLL
ncbi:probable glycosyltransferase At5g03795 [Neltuma alba]|uniref:probable glycosyltransferase At5g03795 n=1 Tax=Neltuma alba TaxID=207710 RepID=UPI0010A454FD|nr:probable glycosyltransferase At5g03795 [Prosopis alba]